jgi:hypothetical protein
MKMINLSGLLGIFVALFSCGQSYSPDDLSAYTADSDPVPEYKFEVDILAGSSSSSVYLRLPQLFAAPKDDYEYFFNFRLENFAPRTEPFIRERFGSRLGIKEASLWEYNSYSSHAVGFSSSLPAISVIEYGETAAIALPDRTFTTKPKLYQKDFTHYNEDYKGTLSGLWITEPGIYVLMEDGSNRLYLRGFPTVSPSSVINIPGFCGRMHAISCSGGFINSIDFIIVIVFLEIFRLFQNLLKHFFIPFRWIAVFIKEYR